MNIELVYPNIVHNEIIIGYDTYPITCKAEGIFIHEARVSHTLPIRLGYVCYSSGLRLLHMCRYHEVKGGPITYTY